MISWRWSGREYKLAHALASEVYDMRVSTHGPRHLDTVPALERLCRAKAAAGRLREARDLYWLGTAIVGDESSLGRECILDLSQAHVRRIRQLSLDSEANSDSVPEILELARHATDLAPDEWSSCFARAHAERLNQNWDSSLHWAERAVSSSSHSAYNWHLLTKIEWEKGNRESAYDWYTVAHDWSIQKDHRANIEEIAATMEIPATWPRTHAFLHEARQSKQEYLPTLDGASIFNPGDKERMVVWCMNELALREATQLVEGHGTMKGTRDE